MKQLFATFVAIFFLNTSAVTAEDSAISWLQDFETAAQTALLEQKPIILFFTGSDWCGWCQKLKREVLDTEDFARRVDGKFIFVELDFPRYKTLPVVQERQNRSLLRRYQVRGFPTIIVLGADQEIVAKTGYLPIGPERYAEHLFSMLEDGEALGQAMRGFRQKYFSGVELEALYKQAKKLGRNDAAERLFTAGIRALDSTFFLAERYREKMLEGNIAGSDTESIRERLLKADPENVKGMHSYVAVLDFQVRANDDEQKPKDVIKPLVEYIDNFKEKDQKNLWRMQMMASQYLFSKELVQEAVEFAEAAHSGAPDDLKEDIKQSIAHMKSE